jgi:hypothetical protein
VPLLQQNGPDGVNHHDNIRVLGSDISNQSVAIVP